MSDEADKTGQIDRGLNTADRHLHTLDEAASAYAQVFVMLRDELPDGHSDARTRISNAIDNTAAVTRSVRTYYNRLNTLRQRESEYTNQKTNRRLGLLSVLSAIFLPLTLLTGIFGMNFENMPGLELSWAYPALLLSMLVIGLLLWRYFVRRGWP
jgi:magnesium transporter